MNNQNDVAVAAVQRPHTNQTVLWVIAVLLAIIATALVLRPETPLLGRAYGDSPMVGARGIFAFTGQIDRNSFGLFMMDVDANTVWCYQYVPSLGCMRLVAARSFLYDRYLENYNSCGPTLDQAKQMLDNQRDIRNRNSRGGAAPDKPLEPSDMTTDMATKQPPEPTSRSNN